MGWELDCASVVPGCEQQFRGDTEGQVLAQLGDHLREHGIDAMSPEMTQQARADIRTSELGG